MTCDRDIGPGGKPLPDSDCGCARSWVGLGPRTATTTALVAERDDLDPGSLARLLRRSLEAAGWAAMISEGELAQWVAQHCADIIQTAAAFPVGAVLEKRGDTIQRRQRPAARTHRRDRAPLR